MQEQVRNFQELNVFENDNINRVCDKLFDLTQRITGKDLLICGSMAKVFDGQLPIGYQPKDVDFTISSWFLRKLKSRLPKKIEGVVMIEKQPNRIIFYCQNIVVEIFGDDPKYKFVRELYKTKIPYTKYVN